MMPLLWAVVVGAGIGLTLRLAGTRFAWLTAATTVAVSLPRLFVYNVTYLMVGAESRATSRSARSIE